MEAVGEKWPQNEYIARQQSQQIIRALGAGDLRRVPGMESGCLPSSLWIQVSPLTDLWFMFFPQLSPPSPSLPWEPQVSAVRVVEWFHTGWGFQPGVLNARGFGGAEHNAVFLLPPEYLFSPSPKSASLLFSPLFFHRLSAVVHRAGPLQSHDIACVFMIFGNSVSDKLMFCAAFIMLLSIVLKGSLLQIFT